MISYIPFIGNALLTCPDGWDSIVVMHQMDLHNSENTVSAFNKGVYTVGAKGAGCLYQLLSAFKLKISTPVTPDGGVYEKIDGTDTYKYPNLAEFMTSRFPSEITFDYSNRTSGRCFVLSGHFHFDDAWIVQEGSGGQSYAWGYNGKEYGYYYESEHPERLNEILSTAVMNIQIDRACIIDQGDTEKKDAAGDKRWPYAVSFPNDRNTVSNPTEDDVVRFGTTTEVLFDIVTITSDNKIVCTRIGGGDDRTFELP